MKHTFLTGCILLFTSGLLCAQQVTRGPYLQLGTPSGMTIRWRTDVAVVGKVNFGTALSTLDNSVSGGAATTEHILQIDGLQPATIYYYDIGTASSILLAANADMYFKTSPSPGTAQPIRVWVIGDFGNASQGQLDVLQSYLNYSGSTHTDVWLWTGDNAYGDGTQQEYQTKVFDIYTAPFKKMVAWPCPGNHDYGSIDISNNGPYFDIFTLPENGEAGGVPSGTEGYYSYDYGNAHFISLNSEYLLWTLTGNTAMTNWLEDDLENNDKDWVIVYWHQPPYSRGSHDSDDAFGRMGMMRANINPILEEHGVDLVLNGHSHCYERSYMIKGHFGNANTFNPAAMILDSVQPFVKYTDGGNPNQGTVYSVVGCSGQLSASGNLDHPAMQYCTNSYNGSMVIDIDDNTLTAKFLTAHDGIMDSFTIQKLSLLDTVSTAIASSPETDALRVFPNPAKDALHVQFNMGNAANATVALLNIKGEQVAQLYKGEIRSGESKDFSVLLFPTGLYFIRVSAGNFSSVAKVILDK